MNYKEELSGLMSRRRNDVLEAAFRLFSERSIESVTMNDIADASGVGIATVFRYFGTKLDLCVELGGKKWKEFGKVVEKDIFRHNCFMMSAYEMMEFYIDRYVLLFDEFKPLLRYNSDFFYFATHQSESRDEALKAMNTYLESLLTFSKAFHLVYVKAGKDHTLRTDIPEEELFVTSMYILLTLVQRLAYGLIYPGKDDSFASEILSLAKDMILSYLKPRE